MAKLWTFSNMDDSRVFPMKVGVYVMRITRPLSCLSCEIAVSLNLHTLVLRHALLYLYLPSDSHLEPFFPVLHR